MSTYTKPCTLLINERIVAYVPATISIEKTETTEHYVYRIKFKMPSSVDAVSRLVEWMKFYRNEIVLKCVELENESERNINIVFKNCFFKKANYLNDYLAGSVIDILFESNCLEEK